MQLTAHRPERSVFIFLSILAFFQKDNVRSERLGNVASCWTRCGSVNLLDSEQTGCIIKELNSSDPLQQSLSLIHLESENQPITTAKNDKCVSFFTLV